MPIISKVFFISFWGERLNKSLNQYIFTMYIISKLTPWIKENLGLLKNIILNFSLNERTKYVNIEKTRFY